MSLICCASVTSQPDCHYRLQLLHHIQKQQVLVNPWIAKITTPLPNLTPKVQESSHTTHPCLEACADIDTDDYSTCLLFGFLFSQNHKNSNNQKQPSMTCVPVYLHGDHSNKNLVVWRFGFEVLFEVCESYFQPNFVSQNFSFSFQIKGSSLLCNE